MPDLIFWDVDTQVDFVHSDGKLYVPDSEAIVDNLKRLTEHAHREGISIVASADDHLETDEEISSEPDFRDTFPPHCMRGTPGQQKIAETALRNPMEIQPVAEDAEALASRVRRHEGDFLLLKNRFDVFANPNTPTVVDALDPSAVVLYGVALDVCDRYAIEGLLRHRPGTAIHLITDASRAIDPDEGRRLQEKWAQRGVRMISTEDALEMRAEVTAGGPSTE